MSLTFTIRPTTPTGVGVVLSGRLDEAARDPLLELRAKIASSKPVIFDTGGISMINSVGIAHWTAFVRMLEPGYFEFVNCSVVFMDYASLAPATLMGAPIRTFNAPLVCETCDEESTILIDPSTFAADRANLRCRKCSKPLTASGWLDEWLHRKPS
jgi:hypothetical protein